MTKFRFDINALRAIAVISVLLFHLKVPYFSGGFIGVDVFFVISGYLMTSIIFDGIGKNEFSIINFWVKRLKRIVPALLVLTLFVTAVGFFFYLPSVYMANEKNATASLLFYSNVLYRYNSNYFDSPAGTNIFLHTWSLSVEWQFYLIYPIIIVILKRLLKNWNYIAIFIGISTILLLALSIYVSHFSVAASFYLLPTRTWEMLFGSLAFLLERKLILKNKFLLISLYGLIFLSIFLFSDKLLWPGIFTTLPVIATFGIIVLNENDYGILRSKIVQFIGKISYSLYLWHWPFIVFLQYMGFQLNALTIFGIIILSFAFASLSYLYVESLKFKRVTPIILSLILLVICTYTLSSYNLNSKMFKEKTIYMANFATRYAESGARKKQFSTGCCFIESANISNNNEEIRQFKQRTCLKIDTTKKNFLLLGDSHAAMLSASFKEQFNKQNINLLQATTAPQGFPFLSQFGNSDFATKLYNYIYFDYLVKNKKYINGVIISGNWYSNYEEVTEPLLKVINYLKSLGISTVVIGQNNIYIIPFPFIEAKGIEDNSDLTDFYSDKKG